jgi:hypothetical protein
MLTSSLASAGFETADSVVGQWPMGVEEALRSSMGRRKNMGEEVGELKAVQSQPASEVDSDAAAGMEAS